MRNSNHTLSAVVCFLLFSLAVVAFFSERIFENIPIGELVYIKVSSIFFASIILMIFAYIARLASIKRTNKEQIYLSEQILNVDINKVSDEQFFVMFNDFDAHQKGITKSKFLLYTMVIPFASMYTAAVFLCLYLDSSLSLFVLFLSFFGWLIIKGIMEINGAFESSLSSGNLTRFCKITANAARGIKLFNSKEFLLNKLKEKTELDLKINEGYLNKVSWKIFLSVFIFFVSIVTLIVMNGSIVKNIYNITLGEPFLLSIVLFSFMGLCASFEKYKHSRAKTFSIQSLALQEKIETKTRSIINSENIPIAFHGVSFFDPRNLDRQIFSDLTFSMLPKERLAICGPNRDSSDYITDLLLKFYKPQCGNIYVGGVEISSARNSSVRSCFSVFDEHLGLIDGTIFENLQASGINRSKAEIIHLAEQVGLQDSLAVNLFNKKGLIGAPQEILIRLQIARVFMKNDATFVIINQPPYFESLESKELFDDFVNYISGKKGIIISTTSLPIIVNSAKILYLSDNLSTFGSHADLVSVPEYRDFISFASSVAA